MTIVKHDYPAQWPNITPLITQALSSGNEQAIMTGLFALFALAKRFEYEMESDREPLFSLMN
jgi:hypothetical protein